jgi:predicted porin
MLAAPAAFAQTTVTITGKVMATFGQFKQSGRAPGAVGNSSENLVRDESSRIIFLMREDLGGGMAAIAKVDVRYATSESNAGQASGESYVGLTSPTWGTIALGKFDFHYGNSASFTGVHGGLQTNPTSIMDRAAAGATAIANQTRTQNAIRYGSPKWGDMFEVIVGYSANATAASTALGAAGATGNEADYGVAVRKGSAWNVQPKIYGKNWEASYSYWSSKPDGQVGMDKQRGDSLYGWYLWGGLRVGLAYNRSKITAVGGGDASNRTAWGLPIAYNWGNHNIYLDLNRARADKAAVFAGTDTKANFLGLTYAYDMSKRTTAAVSYSRIKNGANAAYGLFAQQQATLVGEDPRFIGVTLQHRF